MHNTDVIHMQFYISCNSENGTCSQICDGLDMRWYVEPLSQNLLIKVNIIDLLGTVD